MLLLPRYLLELVFCLRFSTAGSGLRLLPRYLQDFAFSHMHRLRSAFQDIDTFFRLLWTGYCPVLWGCTMLPPPPPPRLGISAGSECFCYPAISRNMYSVWASRSQAQESVCYPAIIRSLYSVIGTNFVLPFKEIDMSSGSCGLGIVFSCTC
jgi:hypothetical protein